MSCYKRISCNVNNRKLARAFKRHGIPHEIKWGNGIRGLWNWLFGQPQVTSRFNANNKQLVTALGQAIEEAKQ